MAPLAINNIDTDQIIPARFLKTTTKQGLDSSFFATGATTPRAIPNRISF
jgi:3-isopropylmalate/(R)-2-methylmalate dehydratase small subunit